MYIKKILNGLYINFIFCKKKKKKEINKFHIFVVAVVNVVKVIWKNSKEL